MRFTVTIPDPDHQIGINNPRLLADLIKIAIQEYFKIGAVEVKPTRTRSSHDAQSE